jgi:predicted O-methyltransferase YrrM
MKHFYEDRKFEENWFTYAKFYESMVKKASDGNIFVEVGSWKGKSSAFMAVEIINSGKNIAFICVDTWEGSDEHYEYQKELLYEKFMSNIEPVKHIIKPMKMTSIEAASKFQNQTIDFCFIDASHDYENVKNDINAWLPKVKNNGIIGGHDYHHNRQYWPGVAKAVQEVFSKDNIKYEGDWWWYDVQRT